MIEAMACGTPVIAFGCGSVPEVIDDGVTGFVVDTSRRRWRRSQARPLLDRAASGRAFERASPPSAWRATTSRSTASLAAPCGPVDTVRTLSEPIAAAAGACRGRVDNRWRPAYPNAEAGASDLHERRRTAAQLCSSRRPPRCTSGGPRTLKHDDTFAVFDHGGDVLAGPGQPRRPLSPRHAATCRSLELTIGGGAADPAQLHAARRQR